MDVKNLKQRVLTLATLSESESPVVSCYVDLSGDHRTAMARIGRQAHYAQKALPLEQRDDVAEALLEINRYVLESVHPACQGIAVFIRGGQEPFFMGLQFYLPVTEGFIVDSTPNIYHLVEMKDSYHRYVLVLATTDSCRILTVNCGTATEKIWREFPEARERISREWSREAYRNNLRGRRRRVVNDIADAVDNVIRQDGFNHLILAGNPSVCAQLRGALSKQASGCLIDHVEVSGNETLTEVIQATIPSFMSEEAEESARAVGQLRRRIHTDGLACMGPADSLHAMEIGCADKLVIAHDYPDGAQREQMVKLAIRMSASIEIVKDSADLQALGGVGCILRYPLQHYWEKDFGECRSNPVVHGEPCYEGV